ncbi:MAG: alpha/beta hydrolase [Woeseia sp.]
MTDVEERWYDSADGLSLYYRRYGATQPGLPVVCLPGITRNSRDFEDLALHLARSHPVLTPDLRGRGRSEHDPNWRNYQPGTYVDDVVRLLDDADVARAAFIGTSLGGLVSMLLAAAHRARVAGVVLNDIGPEIGPAGLERIKSYIGRIPPVRNWDEALQQVREIYGAAWPDLDDDVWSRIVRRGYRENEDGIPVLDMDPKIGDAAREAGTSAGDPWRLFAALDDVPVLVLHGETSDILTDDIVAKMRAAKPDLDYVRVARRGHVPLLDEPESLAAIDDFLAGLQ